MADGNSRSYNNTVISGDAHAHLGDSYHYHHHQSLPQQDKYALLHHSLTFGGMEARIRNVERALSQTCGWLHSRPEFLSWTDESQAHEHHGLLWIKGKPGCGKSTIMKETLEWARAVWKHQTILAFFFNARAPEELQKSTLGLYQTLTYQLLSQNEHVRHLFTQEFSPKEKDGKVEEWKEVELQNFILNTVSNRSSMELNIFVDALDEGDEEEVQQMLTFFEKVAGYAISAGSCFRLCFSSRHFPAVSITTGNSIIVERQPGHASDIRTYIDRTLPGKDDQMMRNIRDTLIRKADGVFLWVVLTVSLLKPLHSRGRVQAMQQKLKSIPSSLHDLFTEILSRDGENMDECIASLQWALASQRPLSVMELYHALHMRYTVTPSSPTISVDEATATSYVTDCSRGLVEAIDTNGLLVVQFIHETVRQFLITINQSQKESQASWCKPCDFKSETCHSTIVEDCLKYLLHLCKELSLNDVVCDRHCLAEYSATYWPAHLRQANSNQIKSEALDLAGELLGSDAYLLTWARIYNHDTGDKSDGSLTLDMVATGIYYAVLVGVPKLLDNILAKNTDVDTLRGNIFTPLQLACEHGFEEGVTLLLDAGANVDASGIASASPLRLAASRGHYNVVRVLINAGADVSGGGAHGATALSQALLNGHEQVARVLVDAGADVDEIVGESDTALKIAALKGNLSMVLMLINAGADVNIRGTCGATALFHAVWNSHLTVVQTLIDAGADVNTYDDAGVSALYRALTTNEDEIAKMLIRSGANRAHKRKDKTTELMQRFLQISMSNPTYRD